MLIKPGHPYDRRGGSLPEGTYYAWCGDRHELAIVHRGPTAEAHAAIDAGDVELAFVHESPVILVLARIVGLSGWREAPFCWHLLPRSERLLPRPLREGESTVLDLVMVGAADGLVDSVGWMALDPAFSWALHRAICEEAGRAWDSHRFHRAFEALRARCPTSDLLLDLAVPCRRARIPGRRTPTLDEVLRAETVTGAGDPPPAADPPEASRSEALDPDDTAVRGVPDPGGA